MVVVRVSRFHFGSLHRVNSGLNFNALGARAAGLTRPIRECQAIGLKGRDHRQAPSPYAGGDSICAGDAEIARDALLIWHAPGRLAGTRRTANPKRPESATPWRYATPRRHAAPLLSLRDIFPRGEDLLLLLRGALSTRCLWRFWHAMGLFSQRLSNTHQNATHRQLGAPLNSPAQSAPRAQP
ncbi:hypothetical protein DFR33_1029 [Bradymonas sediminis]|nr:hypothetical protein DFR33_1029 [Bradymonas sediminis]